LEAGQKVVYPTKIVLECPISTEADTWHNYLDLEQTKQEATEVLGVFKPENCHQELIPIEIEWGLITVPPEAIARPISSIQFDIREGYIYRNLNKTLDDPRLIPVTSSGLIIKKKFLKYYLKERLQEYLALGGTRELAEREQLMGSNLPETLSSLGRHLDSKVQIPVLLC
jgi:hypothetical protein